MAKWYGMVGFVVTEETSQSVYEEVAKELPYYGEVTYNRLQIGSSDKVNNDISVRNKISIVADPFLREHFDAIRYVTLLSSKWKVTKVEVSYPRLILTLGGVYNAQ